MSSSLQWLSIFAAFGGLAIGCISLIVGVLNYRRENPRVHVGLMFVQAGGDDDEATEAWPSVSIVNVGRRPVEPSQVYLSPIGWDWYSFPRLRYFWLNRQYRRFTAVFVKLSPEIPRLEEAKGFDLTGKGDMEFARKTSLFRYNWVEATVFCGGKKFFSNAAAVPKVLKRPPIGNLPEIERHMVPWWQFWKRLQAMRRVRQWRRAKDKEERLRAAASEK